MRLLSRLPRSRIAAVHDLLMAALSLPAALYLRLGDRFFHHPVPHLDGSLAAFVLLFAGCAFAFRLERSVWRYVSLREMRLIVQVATLSVAVFYFGLFLVSRLEGIPRSVPAVHLLVLIALLAGPRALYRMLREGSGKRTGASAIPVLVIGAEAHAEQFVRALQRMPEAPYRTVGLLDDGPGQQGRTLHGVPILGDVAALERTIQGLTRRGERPQRLLMSEQSLGPETVARLLDASDRLGIPLARLPRTTEFQEGFTGKVSLSPVKIEDLLGRSQNVHDREGMKRLVAGKRVLVTGAGGSIGAELCRQLSALGPASLLLYDHSEYLLYEIDREMLSAAPRIALHAVLGDVRDEAHLRHLFAQVKPELVFHAAAIKHVPLAEENVVETVLTNVLGTRNAARAAAEAGAEAFVMISTDKAVNPANVMGSAKRLAERVIAAVAADYPGMRFTTVRFGNVLGSRGSVVPLFQQQLSEGGPLTVTHPDIERYFMTIREAVELVLQSAVLHAAEPQVSARIFVLDMGKPVKIDFLARQMIRLAGLKPGADIEIRYSGLRPGEKMYEELFYRAEELEATAHEAIRLARHGEAAAPGADFAPMLAELTEACEARDEQAARARLIALVPEFAAASVSPLPSGEG